MIHKVKSIILRNRILLENFSFLSILQISNLLIFLLIIPYLFRVLGKENYGLVVFAQTIAIYFSIIVNFGFNVTATRDISVHIGNKNKISDVISAILSLKIIFFIISTIILSLFILFIPLLNSHPIIFYLSMLFCLSEALFPIWYFQGIEKMKYITFINVLTRIVSAFLIFVFVKKTSDYFLVPLFLGMGTILGAIIGLYIVFWVHNNKFKLLTISGLTLCVKHNIPLFISNVSSQIYVNSNKLIVGSFLGMQDVAVYDIADKIVNLLKIPVQLIGQTLFPRVSRDKDVRFVKKSMIFVFIFFVIVYTSIYLFANPIIYIISGSSSNDAVLLLRILAISLLPICLGLFFAELLLIPFGMIKDYAKMRTYSLFIYLSVIIVLIKTNQIGMYQLAFGTLIVEVFVLFYSYYLCNKNKIL